MSTEREVKLGVWPGFSLPELNGVLPDTEVELAPDQLLEAIYHDTADLRLARWGITLRHRTGDGEDGWTLKLPKGTRGAVLTRDEIIVHGDPTEPPAEILDHMRAWVRTATLQPVSKMETQRRIARVRRHDGELVVEVVDDEVSVFDDTHVALRFREVEVELGRGAPDSAIDEVVARLRAAGAGTPDPTPKVMRALGPRAFEPPELVIDEPGDDATAADVLRAGIGRAVLRVLEHDAGVRLTGDDEAVHQARVGTRRLRSDLRTFAPLLDPKWVEPLRDELKWYADLLGAVRDTDVLTARIATDLHRLDEVDHLPGEQLLSALRAQDAEARSELLAAIATDRYLSLLDALVEAATDPRLNRDAEQPAVEVLPSLTARPWAKLARAVKRSGKHPRDEVLHGIRIRAKRARYAADVAALVVGKPAARFAEAMAALQDVLGEHQDACVRQGWLREAAKDVSPAAALVAGQLVAMAKADAAHHRAEWRGAWDRVNEGKVRAWLTH